MVRICTGEVWVRSSSGLPSGPVPSIARLSCMERAGWSGAKFSASKLYQSVSTSGPSATL